jgi:anti-sigma factor RsiW
MCDFSGKLIAWLDHELPAEDAAEVERHLGLCSECRTNVDAYKRVTGDFDAYCDAEMASSAHRGAPRWAPLATATAAAAAAGLVALFLMTPRKRVQPPVDHPEPAAVASLSHVHVSTTAPASANVIPRIHRRHSDTAATVQNTSANVPQEQNAFVQPNEPMIQIAIPADEMFPPGAVPEGTQFVADVTIAPDGSAERMRLRPRLAGFERRTTQP